jgi:hypothetical protein
MWPGESILKDLSETTLLSVCLLLLDFLYDCRHDLEQVSDDSEVRNLKNGSLWVLVYNT